MNEKPGPATHAARWCTVVSAEDGQTRLDRWFEEKTLWMSQATMVELYQTSKANISIHLKSVF
jgi:hypothetical protein